MNNSFRLALRLVLMVSAFSALWIYVSNDVLSEFAPDKVTLARYHTYIEWFYVLILALLVYSLVKRMLDQQAAAEGRLRESEERLKLFIDHAPVALAMLDRNMCYLAASGLWASAYHFGGKDIIGKSLLEISPAIPERWKRLLLRGLNGETVDIGEDYLKRQDGSAQWLRGGVRPWYASDGGVGGIVIFSEDVSARKQAEEALSESEKKYRMLFENSRDALLVNAPPSWEFSAANRSAVQLFGAGSKAELMRLTPWDISPEYQPDGVASAEKARQMLARAMQDGSCFFEWLHKRLNGSTFPAEVFLTRMDFDGEVVIQGSMRDISVRKKLERDIQERRKEMETLQKVQVAAQTASAIAHELNQPLAAISSYSQAALIMLDSGNPDPQQLRAAVEGSGQQALRAGKSIRDMLLTLSMGEFPVERFDLNQEIREVLAATKEEHALQFRSRLYLDEQLAPVLANRTHVQKALLNLLRNSIDAMQEAGVAEPEIAVTALARQDEHVAQVTIKDNGSGIKEADISRLFEPFFTSKRHGVGMGLVISRSLIEANGGQLWMDPHEKSGATFHLTIPLAP